MSVSDGDVRRGIVGHELLDHDASLAEPCHGASEEWDDRLSLLVRKYFGVGQSRGVVDTDVSELITVATYLTGPVAVDAVADASDLCKPFRVNVYELARSGPFIPLGLRLVLKIPKPADAQPLQDATDS